MGMQALLKARKSSAALTLLILVGSAIVILHQAARQSGYAQLGGSRQSRKLSAIFRSKPTIPVERISAETSASATTISDENVSAYSQCIFGGRQPDKFWKDLSSIITNCRTKMMPSLTERLFALHVGRYNETKVYLDYLKPDAASTQCRSLTIGIGGDIVAEEELQKRYPSCQLYGLDPKQLQGWSFINVGTYVPYGLSIDGGLLNLTVRKPNGVYGVETVPTISMAQLVARYTGRRPFHFAILDIEGGEYKLLPQFGRHGSFSPATSDDADTRHGGGSGGPVFCQLDVEFHGPPKTQSIRSSAQFYRFLNDFVSQSDFVPIYGKDHMPSKIHRKVTFVNFRAPVCNEVFGTGVRELLSQDSGD